MKGTPVRYVRLVAIKKNGTQVHLYKTHDVISHYQMRSHYYNFINHCTDS